LKDEYTAWWDNNPEKPGNKEVKTMKSNCVISEMEAEELLKQQNEL